MSRAATKLSIAIGFLIAVLAIVPAAFADTGTPINGSIKLSYDLNTDGSVTVYAQGQWNWQTHRSDCNVDRAGAGVAMIWNDPNEPGYTLTGKDVNGKAISYGVGVAKRLNGDTYNVIDGTVHPVDIGIEGGANPGQPGAAGQQFQDVAPVASGQPQDYKNWRGGCGREPLNGPQFAGIPYGSWGYDQEVNSGRGFSHTYMSVDDIKTVCVNLYDVHGGDKIGGKHFQVPAGNNEIDAAKAGDNTIKAGQFDPQGLNCVTPQPDLSVTKDNGVNYVTAGKDTTYTIVVTNNGQEPAVNQTVSDLMPAGITSMSWHADASPGSTVESPASGNGAIATTVNVNAGGTVTFTVLAHVSATATGTVKNTVTVGIPAGDLTPANNTATDEDPIVVPPPPVFDLAVVSNDDGVGPLPFDVSQVHSLTYTIVVANNGPDDAPAALFTDSEIVAKNGFLLPVDPADIAWHVVADAAHAVSGPQSGSGGISASLTLPAGASVTFSVTYTPASGGFPPEALITNQATIDQPGGDANLANGTASDQDFSSDAF